MKIGRLAGNTTISLCGLLLVGASYTASADSMQSLAGEKFAVEVEVISSIDVAMPVGTTFDNCYIFEEDNTWIDPVFPTPVHVSPGTWVQHTDGPVAAYTAHSRDPASGLLIIQSGTSSNSKGKSDQRLEAYTTVYFGGLLLVEFISIGKSVEECP